MRYLEEQGGNPFLDYLLPTAIISLKQGFGRLLRSQRDKGIVTILDSRLASRSYGARFLTSLPTTPILCPPTSSMVQARTSGGSSPRASVRLAARKPKSAPVNGSPGEQPSGAQPPLLSRASSSTPWSSS